MAYGSTNDLRRIVGEDPDFDLDAVRISASGTGSIAADMSSGSTLTFHVAENLKHWTDMAGSGIPVGKGRFMGQCAVLTQAATRSSVGRTSWWIQGPRVQRNAAIVRGTAIAAGWEEGRYRSHKHRNTAMIFLGFLPGREGFRGLHQYVADDGSMSGVFIETILPYYRARADRYYAEQFNVILTYRRICWPDLNSDGVDDFAHRSVMA